MAFFDFVSGYEYEPVDIPIFLTLLLLEGALSFDNAAILAAMVRKLPVEQRRKALLYGLAGAYVFRLTAILLVSFIIQNPWLKVLGGLYLVYLAGRHLLDRTPHDMHVPGVAQRRFLGISPFWSVVIAVELADIAFALDQVLVAVGLFASGPGEGDKRLLIVAASFVAIVLLRISAYYVSKLMDWFPRLETLAYVAVGFVGVKLVAVELAAYLGFHDTPAILFIEDKLVSVAVTLCVIGLPVLWKVVHDFVIEPRRRRSA